MDSPDDKDAAAMPGASAAGTEADDAPECTADSARPRWLRRDIARGMRMVMPVLPGMIAFALAVGAAAAAKGLSLLQSVLMNALVFAGASQLVALEVWPRHFTLGVVAGLALVVATVNARLLLITASLQPGLRHLPAWQVYPLLHITTDLAWLITMRAQRDGASAASVFLGSSLVLLTMWMAVTTLGFGLGALVGDPRRFGLDLVMPIFFAAMLVPLWRGASPAIPWLVAGAVAVAVRELFGGWYFVVAGAFAGMLVGGFLDDDD
jgi:predicted branched-subunit amino acid permease